MANRAGVSEGTFAVPIKCNLSETCEGIVQIIGPELEHLAAAEFTLSPRMEGTVGVALTEAGKQRLASANPYSGGEAVVALKERGYVTEGSIQHFELTE